MGLRAATLLTPDAANLLCDVSQIQNEEQELGLSGALALGGNSKQHHEQDEFLSIGFDEKGEDTMTDSRFNH